MLFRSGSSAANELLVTGGHVGTHVDALAHVSYQGRLHGGISADEAQRGGKFTTHGIDQMEPIIGRGVLLDVASLRGVEVLPPGYGISAADLEQAAHRADVEVRRGDTILIHSGWSCHFADAETYQGHVGGVPGPTEEAARWLAERGIRATGGETIAYEQIPPGAGQIGRAHV